MTVSFIGMIVAAISAFGYVGIALLMAIESACIPLPSEVILTFSGYLVFSHRFTLLGVTLAGTVGCNLGSTLAYWVGGWGGRPLVARYGRIILLDWKELLRIERFFQRYGSLTVLIGRMLPIVRTYIAFPAGMARMNLAKFQLYTFAGSLPWCFALAYAGMIFGRQWHSHSMLSTSMRDFTAIVIGGLLLVGTWYARRLWYNRIAGDLQ